MIAFVFLCVLFVTIAAVVLLCLAVMYRSENGNAQAIALIVGVVCALGCIGISSQLYFEAKEMDRRNHATEQERVGQPSP